MDTIFIIIGFIFLIVGIIGCILPGIPGPIVAFMSMVFVQFTDSKPFETDFLFYWGATVIIVTILDYFVPIWGTKKFGGTKYGMWGSIVGLVIGLVTGPWGVVIGAFLGAYIGELIGGMRNESALRAGLGAFLGFVAGTIMKLGVSLYIGALFFIEVWNVYFPK